MTLKPNQTCLYSDKCKYHNLSNICQGMNPSRKTVFQCEFIDDNGNSVSEGYVRSLYDITGKMELIKE